MSKSKRHPNSLANLKDPWKKGSKDIPKGGRPKGSKNTKTIIKEVLNAILTASESTEKDSKGNPVRPFEALEKQLGRELTRREAIVFRQVAKACTGDTLAFKTLIEFEEGKATQRIEADNKVTLSDFVDGLPEPDSDE